MTFHVYAHDQGCTDYVRSFDTRQSALSYVKDLRNEFEEHPSWYALAAPWFEISDEPPYQITYVFEDHSDLG